LFGASHFLILPTRADATPIVLCEAAAFGVPSLTTAVGGIPSVVSDGENGMLFPADAAPEAYCDAIEAMWSDPHAYRELALSSFAEYRRRLNWNTAAATVAGLIRERLPV
jgi:glycosyltransferase involved in cell wall biosynthesis